MRGIPSPGLLITAQVPARSVLSLTVHRSPAREITFGLVLVFFFFTLQHWMQSQDELNELTQPADVFISTPLINGDVGSPGLLQVAVSVVAAAGAPGLGSCSR